jgi:DNA-binding response OmpR family regulator
MDILVIEDDLRMATLLARGLRESGHQVCPALNGRDGFEFARLHEYDVIVLDVLLPLMDGIEVTRRLRKSGNRTPILMLTARDAPKDAAQGLDIGADDYMTDTRSRFPRSSEVRSAYRNHPSRIPDPRAADAPLGPRCIQGGTDRCGLGRGC